MKQGIFAILCVLSLAACGSRSKPSPAVAAASAPVVAPVIPLPLPRAKEFSEPKPPVTPPATETIESHVWGWTSRQMEAGKLPPPTGSVEAALDKVAKEEASTISALASQVTRLVPLTQLESAGDALRYYQERYGLANEFKPVVVAVAPVNKMEIFRSGAGVGSGTIGGVFYVPSRDAWKGPIDREALEFTFGTPYVIFMDEASLSATSPKATSVLVHELKHYLDYRRDSSDKPTYAEPEPIAALRARVSTPAAEVPSLDYERHTAQYQSFLERAQSPEAKARIEKKYDAYFAEEWRSHLPYLLRAGEISAFLEQVRFYKYGLGQSEAQTIDAMTEPDNLPAGTVALPALSITREIFRTLFRAG